MAALREAWGREGGDGGPRGSGLCCSNPPVNMVHALSPLLDGIRFMSAQKSFQ